MSRIVIAGGGIVGLSVARAALARRHHVVVLEQGELPNPHGASFDRHRMIRPHYGDAIGYTRMVADAFRAWDEVWRDLGTRHFDDSGAIAVSLRAGDYADRTRATFRTLNIVHRVLQGAELARLCPQLDLPAEAWG